MKSFEMKYLKYFVKGPLPYMKKRYLIISSETIIEQNSLFRPQETHTPLLLQL